MIKVPMTLIVECDNPLCGDKKVFTMSIPYGISEVEVLKFYLFNDWRDSGTWVVTENGEVFCSQHCASEEE